MAMQAEVEANLSNEPACASPDLHSQLVRAREAQRDWQAFSLKARLCHVRRIRQQIAEQSEALASSVSFAGRTSAAETLAAEIIPLADACRFLEKEASRVLRPRRLARRGRPAWLRGVTVDVHREPFGIVLIIGASNYPIFLPGVQALQAIVAGNAVLLKPGEKATASARRLADLFAAAGVHPDLLQLLPEPPSSVERAVQAGVDKVVLTGSAETGRKVQSLLSATLTPSIMELSGCDAVFVTGSADLDLVARCLSFGLRFNSSATCIAPRRVFVPQNLAGELEHRLRQSLQAHPHRDRAHHVQTRELVSDALRDGATLVCGGPADGRLTGPLVLSGVDANMPLLRADVFDPVLALLTVESMDQALQVDRQCPYALGAAIFGRADEADQLAKQVDAGCIVVNDMIAPTADPRVPFGGRRQSGFGVTRGAIGLQEMTCVKTVIHQRSRWRPHLDAPTPQDARLLEGFLKMAHGRGWSTKLGGLRKLVAAVTEQRKQNSKKE